VWQEDACGDGKMISFWCDAWCGLSPLKDTFPIIFNICNEQSITVVNGATLGWNFTFRRYLSPELAVPVHGMLGILR
jgi:hypothetical protein